MTAADRLDAMVAHLRREGHRISPQRLEILRALAESPDHPSAESLYRRLLPRFPDMSLATVYKTIAALKQCGEILELQFSDRDNRYDAKRPEPHPHCICLECGPWSIRPRRTSSRSWRPWSRPAASPSAPTAWISTACARPAAKSIRADGVQPPFQTPAPDAAC